MCRKEKERGEKEERKREGGRGGGGLGSPPCELDERRVSAFERWQARKGQSGGGGGEGGGWTRRQEERTGNKRKKEGRSERGLDVRSPAAEKRRNEERGMAIDRAIVSFYDERENEANKSFGEFFPSFRLPSLLRCSFFHSFLLSLVFLLDFFVSFPRSPPHPRPILGLDP